MLLIWSTFPIYFALIQEVLAILIESGYQVFNKNLKKLIDQSFSLPRYVSVWLFINAYLSKPIEIS